MLHFLFIYAHKSDIIEVRYLTLYFYWFLKIYRPKHSLNVAYNNTMAYIPLEHRKYKLLPMSREHGGEVFSYPSKLLDDLETYLPEGENMIPYGYDSFEQYMDKMDELASQYFKNEKLQDVYKQFKEQMIEMNTKEDWSILKYIGESDKNIFGLTRGNVYYWPCSKRNPHYEGVIDDEEFTSYWYPTEAENWQILEDPTGMAYATIFDKATGHTTRKEHEDIMKNIEDSLL